MGVRHDMGVVFILFTYTGSTERRAEQQPKRAKTRTLGGNTNSTNTQVENRSLDLLYIPRFVKARFPLRQTDQCDLGRVDSLWLVHALTMMRNISLTPFPIATATSFTSFPPSPSPH